MNEAMCLYFLLMYHKIHVNLNELEEFISVLGNRLTNKKFKNYAEQHQQVFTGSTSVYRVLSKRKRNTT